MSTAASTRGVWRLIPRAPLSFDIPLPLSKRIVARRGEMSVIGTRFGEAAIHAPSRNESPSRTATSQSRSSGGRTVARKSLAPAASGSSVRLALR